MCVTCQALMFADWLQKFLNTIQKPNTPVHVFSHQSYCAVVKNAKIVFFGQKCCVRLNETLEPDVSTCMMNIFTPRLTDVQITQCGKRWFTMQSIGSSNPSSDSGIFLSFLLHCFFLFLSTFVFPFLALKRSSGALNHSFIWIAFAQYHETMWGKTPKTFLDSNR